MSNGSGCNEQIGQRNQAVGDLEVLEDISCNSDTRRIKRQDWCDSEQGIHKFPICSGRPSAEFKFCDGRN